MSEISEAIQEIYIKEALAHPAQPINTHGFLNAPADKKTMAHSTRQPINNTWLTPQGHRLCEPYQNPDAGRLAPGVSYILPI